MKSLLILGLFAVVLIFSLSLFLYSNSLLETHTEKNFADPVINTIQDLEADRDIVIAKAKTTEVQDTPLAPQEKKEKEEIAPQKLSLSNDPDPDGFININGEDVYIRDSLKAVVSFVEKIHAQDKCSSIPLPISFATIKSHTYWELVENFFNTFEKFGIKECAVLLCANDQVCMDLCDLNDLNCVNFVFSGPKISSLEIIAILKLRVLQDIFSKGISLLTLDLDVGFLSNPIDYIQYALAKNPSLELILQKDFSFGRTQEISWTTTSVLNIGIMYTKGTPRSVKIFKSAWEKYSNVDSKRKGQPGFDQMFLQSSIQQEPTWDFFPGDSFIMADKVIKFFDQRMELGGEVADVILGTSTIHPVSPQEDFCGFSIRSVPLSGKIQNYHVYKNTCHNFVRKNFNTTQLFLKRANYREEGVSYNNLVHTSLKSRYASGIPLSLLQLDDLPKKDQFYLGDASEDGLIFNPGNSFSFKIRSRYYDMLYPAAVQAVHATCYQNRHKINVLKMTNSYWNKKYYLNDRRTLTIPFIFSKDRKSRIINDFRVLIYSGLMTGRSVIIPNIVYAKKHSPVQNGDNLVDVLEIYPDIPVPYFDQILWPAFRTFFLNDDFKYKSLLTILEPSYYWKVGTQYLDADLHQSPEELILNNKLTSPGFLFISARNTFSKVIDLISSHQKEKRLVLVPLSVSSSQYFPKNFMSSVEVTHFLEKNYQGISTQRTKPFLEIMRKMSLKGAKDNFLFDLIRWSYDSTSYFYNYENYLEFFGHLPLLPHNLSISVPTDNFDTDLVKIFNPALVAKKTIELSTEPLYENIRYCTLLFLNAVNNRTCFLECK